MNSHSNLQSRARRIACIGMVLLTALAGCGGGGGGDDGETVVTPPPRQTPAPRPMIPINPGSGSQSLPPVYSPQNPPQAGGRDASGVEVSGLGNITQVAVRNTRSGSVTFQAGQWFEPKDGGFQRMITTRTTSVPSGSTVNVPVACMQREKGAPANGLRFFSQPKTASDATQQCQVNCLSSGGNPQSCVWGCQSSGTSGGGTVSRSRSPTTATTETTSRSAFSSTAACPTPTPFRLPRIPTGRGRADPTRTSPRGSTGRPRSDSPATVLATGRVSGPFPRTTSKPDSVATTGASGSITSSTAPGAAQAATEESSTTR